VTVIRGIKKWDTYADDKVAASGRAIEKALEEVESFNTSGIKSLRDVRTAIDKWHKEMLKCAKAHEFEQAAKLRDRVRALKTLELQLLETDAG
jgi:protein-arginine kinase activator protein McsA